MSLQDGQTAAVIVFLAGGHPLDGLQTKSIGCLVGIAPLLSERYRVLVEHRPLSGGC